MILYGASGHAKVIIEILEANKKQIDFIVDDNPALNELIGYEVRRNTEEYDEAIISIGSCEIRKRISENIKVKNYVTAIHPTAIVSPRTVIGEGSVVMHGAVLQSCTNVGKHCIINTCASVDHDCVLGDFVHIAPHATVLGGVTIGDGSWIGAGAVLKQYITIGKNCTIGAGAVVLKDVSDGATVIGVPAKEIK